MRRAARYLCASCLWACAPAPPASPAAAPPAARGAAPTAREDASARGPSSVALRRDYVERLRAHVASLEPSGRALRMVQVQLGDALVGLAAAELEEAMARDPSVRRLAPPEDVAARAEAERDEESDAPPPEGPSAQPSREAAALAALSPVVRAYVEAHDRALAEAAQVYARARVGEKDRRAQSAVAAREARVLTTLGQRQRARLAWFAALKGDALPVDAFDAWLAFADHFAERHDELSLSRFLDKARAVASTLPDPEAACARARAWVRYVSVASVCEGAVVAPVAR